MNAFADSLFSMLFGWLRALVQGIWNAAASGGIGGLLTWLGDHWLWVALIVMIGATVLDFIIWMIRWRPYLVWKTKLRRLYRRIRYGNAGAIQRFNQGYQDVVSLDMPPMEEAPYRPAPAPAYEYVAWQDPWSAERDAMPVPAEEEADLVPQPHYQQEEFSPSAPRSLPEQGARQLPILRSRRGEHTDRPRRSIQALLNLEDPDEGVLLDGLPPLMEKEEAFHQPVYPQRSQLNYASWQRPSPQQQEMDHQA